MNIMYKLKAILLILFTSVLISCNRGAGCPASQSPDRMVNVNDNKQGILNKKKANKSSRSNILPKEVKIKKK